MNAAMTLMRTELTLLRRDTTAWAMATAMPLLLGGTWIISAPPFGDGWGAVTVLQVMMLLAFTVHAVGVMVLAARREQLVLKRWRSSQASTTSVLAGSVGMLGGLVVVQAALLMAATVYVSEQLPQNVVVLVGAIVLGIAFTTAATFVVAAFTRSAEHAMITTFPVFLLLLGVAIWALGRPADGVDLALVAVPGGGVAHLLRIGWEGIGSSQAGVADWLRAVGPSVLATALYTAIATVGAVRWFRWDVRR